MKVLYAKKEESGEESGGRSDSAEDMILPLAVFEQLKEDLKRSNDLLPEPARRVLPSSAMREWNVALLDRFDPFSDNG